MIFMRKGEDPPWIVADSLWQRPKPLLPKVERRSRYPGRRQLDDRKVLGGILFVLHTGIRWEFLPKELPRHPAGAVADRRLIRAKGIKHRIGRRGVEHGAGLGKHRYVVELTIALLHWCRRLRIRWEIRDDIREANLSLAAALICWRRLTR
jgi:transposase